MAVDFECLRYTFSRKSALNVRTLLTVELSDPKISFSPFIEGTTSVTRCAQLSTTVGRLSKYRCYTTEGYSKVRTHIQTFIMPNDDSWSYFGNWVRERMAAPNRLKGVGAATTSGQSCKPKTRLSLFLWYHVPLTLTPPPPPSLNFYV